MTSAPSGWYSGWCDRPERERHKWERVGGNEFESCTSSLAISTAPIRPIDSSAASSFCTRLSQHHHHHHNDMAGNEALEVNPPNAVYHISTNGSDWVSETTPHPTTSSHGPLPSRTGLVPFNLVSARSLLCVTARKPANLSPAHPTSSGQSSPS